MTITNEHLYQEIDRLERENAKLIEIVNKRGELIAELLERLNAPRGERAPESSGGRLDPLPIVDDRPLLDQITGRDASHTLPRLTNGQDAIKDINNLD